MRTLVTGVTASLALLRTAVEAGAGALFARHGWFWRDEDARIATTRRRRIAFGLRQRYLEVDSPV